MTGKKLNKPTGGQFLVEQMGVRPVYSRENFTPEHKEIEAMVREFAHDRVRENKDEINKLNKDLSLELLREMGELGLLGVDIPEEYDGLNLDKITTAIVAECISTGYCSSFVTTYSVQTGIGCLPIVWFGTAEQKAKYLPKLVTGEWIGAYGLTEPTSGSDALSAKTKAILSEDGKHYILNGQKQFITNGSWAEVFIIFVQVDGDKFSALIVDRDTEGFEIGPEEKKMGNKGSSTTSLSFTNARVPVENLLYKVGKGAAIAFNVLNLGRFKLAASTLGGSKVITTGAVEYALDRKQFGQSISNFDVIKGKVADMVVRTYSADAMIYRTIGLIQDAIDGLEPGGDDYYIRLGEAMEKFAVEASMAKNYGSETMSMTADTGIQILGGNGYIEEYPMAGAYRDTRIDRIWEGTNEINRQIISGYMMKKALMEQLPIRETIRKIDAFLENTNNAVEIDHLSHEANMIETGKYLALYLFHEALNEYGQDLRHEQQLTEILADMFTEIYTAESTVMRAVQSYKDFGVDRTVLDIACIKASEVSIELLNKSLTGFNAIYHGHLPEAIIAKLRSFQVKMLPKRDIIELKRLVAEHTYHNKRYPF